jgi:dienelactone hydrolase
MGLFWSMEVDTTGKRTDAGPDNAEWSPPELYTVTLTAAAEGRIVARKTIRRLFLAPDVVQREVVEEGLVARLYLPPRSTGRSPVVISLSGSEGGFESVRAPMLASRGFATLAVAYFRAPGLPQELFDVPVETIERAVSWVRRQPELDANRIAIRGSSRGAELALVAAALIPDIHAVIAEAPSDVVGQGIDSAGRSRAASAWSWRGQPLPFMPQIAPPEFTSQFQRRGPPYRLRPLYEASRTDTEALRRAQIPVERINGPILLTSGEDDQYWPSSVHAEAIVARLRAAGFRHAVAHTAHGHAGHQILVPYLPTPPRTTGQFWLAGGTAEGYARADQASWRQTLAFLQHALLPR